MENERKAYFDEIKEMATTYIEDRLLLIKLQVAENVSKASASIFKMIIVAFLLFFILLIVTFLAGYGLSQLTGSLLAGFGILGVVYLLLMFLLIYLYKKYFEKAIVNKVIQALFKEN